MEHKRIPSGVLKWINAERKAMGRKPIRKMLKGTTFLDIKGCPIATSLGRGGVTVSGYNYTRPNGEIIIFPKIINNFHESLMNNEYPQLFGAEE